MFTAENGEDALEKLGGFHIDLVISDVRMSSMDGMKLLREVKRREPTIEFVVMTAYSSTSDAIVAMKDGAYDYITKPFKLDEIKITIEKAIEKREIARENVQLRTELKRQLKVSNIIGKSGEMAKIYKMIQQVADTKTNILITGDSGTGKELVARAVHYSSRRESRPFVTVNCGAIPSELMESELFGHVKGSFTGALRDKEGLFSTANRGTLFLDEVAELPTKMQVKLLRALQERKIMPVGSTEEIELDTRVIAATNRNLEEEVRRGRYREDLYYRLNVIQIRLPPLRERKDDIPLLVSHFIKHATKDLDREPLRISEAASMILMNYDYPGNVRELSNIVERAVALETTDLIRPQSLPPSLLEKHLREPDRTPPETAPAQQLAAIDLSRGMNLDAVLEAQERKLIEKALEDAGGVKTEAARLLGVTFRSLRYRVKKLGIETGSREGDGG